MSMKTHTQPLLNNFTHLKSKKNYSHKETVTIFRITVGITLETVGILALTVGILQNTVGILHQTVGMV